MHSDAFRLRNHPSRHREERDDAALLTQEGNLCSTNPTNLSSRWAHRFSSWLSLVKVVVVRTEAKMLSVIRPFLYLSAWHYQQFGVH